MMAANIYKALPYYLTHHASITPLVSTRVYQDTLPQGVTIPAITFQEISSKANTLHKERSQLPKPIFQFVAYGTKIEEVEPIIQALKTALDGYRGQMGTGAYITDVQGVIFQDRRDLTDPEAELKTMQIDYRIIYKE